MSIHEERQEIINMVDCPKCLVSQGQDCRNTRGNKVMGIHRARIWKAWTAKTPEPQKTLGRPTRDVNGFWQYAIWSERHGTITEYPSRAQALALIRYHQEEMLIRRWMGGWQAAEE